MTERPILFNGEMVRAILGGRKTQTRRVCDSGRYRGLIDFVGPEGTQDDPTCWGFEDGNHGTGWWLLKGDECGQQIPCPYGQPGDRLWVRETWRPHEWPDEGKDEIGDPVGDIAPGTDGIQYRADDAFIPIENTEAASDRWFSLLRPDEAYPEMRETRWRPSIHVPRWASRITLEVTGVRVERVRHISLGDAVAEGMRPSNRNDSENSRDRFRSLWDSINASRGFGWEANPWVWVVEFSLVQGGRSD